ncbi:MAG TPA: hypothetical protein VE127_07815 [Solirubrobacteraceae bacterium]|nr:hypothetical protein [Solirubrobacteraceae bacterium]
MPTIHPRYTVTDTGDVREMLDLAHRRWPDVSDRRQLLLRLAGAGAERAAAELEAATQASQRERQRQALARASQLIDPDALLADSAWR